MTTMLRHKPTAPLHVAIAHERRVVALAAVLVFLICSDAFKIVLGSGFPEGPVKFALSAVMLIFALVNVRFLLRSAFGAPELALLLMLTLVSVLWSLDPELTLKRTFQLYATSALAMVLASMLSMRSLMIALAVFAGLMMVASIVAIGLLDSARGSESWPDTWRGVFNHKNGLGAASAFSLILLSAAISLSKGWPRRVFVVLAILSVVLLVASESRTSQAIAGFSVASILIATMARNHMRIWMLGFLSVFVVGFSLALILLFSGIADPWFEAVGRRATLSNRIPLWEIVWPEAMERIWTGYGYDAYWDPESNRVTRIAQIPFLGFTPYYSHNGLIELLLNVGILGPPLVVVALLRAMTGSFLALRVRGLRIAGASALVALVAFFLFNFTESTLLNRDSFVWFVFVAVSTKLSLLVRPRSRRWQRGPAAAARRWPRRMAGREWAARTQ